MFSLEHAVIFLFLTPLNEAVGEPVISPASVCHVAGSERTSILDSDPDKELVLRIVQDGRDVPNLHLQHTGTVRNYEMDAVRSWKGNIFPNVPWSEDRPVQEVVGPVIPIILYQGVQGLFKSAYPGSQNANLCGRLAEISDRILDLWLRSEVGASVYFDLMNAENVDIRTLQSGERLLRKIGLALSFGSGSNSGLGRNNGGTSGTSSFYEIPNQKRSTDAADDGGPFGPVVSILRSFGHAELLTQICFVVILYGLAIWFAPVGLDGLSGFDINGTNYGYCERRLRIFCGLIGCVSLGLVIYLLILGEP